MDRLLIWDIDGTIMTSKENGAGKKALKAALKQFFLINTRKKDIPEKVGKAFSNGCIQHLEEVNMAGMLDHIILEKTFKDFFINNGKKVFGWDAYHDADIYNFVFESYLKELDDIIKKNSYLLVSGVDETLRRIDSLKIAGNILGTGNIEKAARAKLEQFDLNQYFPTGGFSNGKGERWQVIENAILKGKEYFNQDFEKEKTYIIGDTVSDMFCAVKLGIKAIGVENARCGKEELVKNGACAVFKDFTDTDKFMNVIS